MKYFLKENKCEQNVSKIAHLIKKQESETLVFKWWESSDMLRTYIDEYRYEILRLRPIINCILDKDVCDDDS